MEAEKEEEMEEEGKEVIHIVKLRVIGRVFWW